MDDLDELLAAAARTETVPAHVVDGIRRVCEANDGRPMRQRLGIDKLAAWMASKGVRDPKVRLQQVCREVLGRKSFSQP